MKIEEITKQNVKDVDVLWNYADSSGGTFFNPIVVDGVLYVVAKGNAVVALDATNGKEIWTSQQYPGIIKTGINFWQNKDKTDQRLILCANNFLQAINAKTGQPVPNFGDTGNGTSLKEGMGRDPNSLGKVQGTAPGAIYDDLIFLGMAPGEGYFSPPGHLRAYSVITGKMVWIFHTIPWPGEYGYETWPKDAYKYGGGVNTWGEITVDAQHGIVYYPLGAPTFDYYGADRVGNDLFDECILALDARTGKRIWHFQAVHHGLWDYDLTSAPMLIEIMHDGKQVPAIAVAGKTGFLYVFNRLTGEPIWPIEERPVPKSDVPQEVSSPTQPFPTAPPAFTRQLVTTNDINPFWPEEKRAQWVKRISEAKTGMFHPLSDQYETIAMPGAVGGANRGNTAADPEHGIVYVTANELPSVYKLVKGPANRMAGSANTNAAAPAAQPVEPALNAESVRNTTCNVCHELQRTNMVNVPALTNVARFSLAEFQTLVHEGKGLMPANPLLEPSVISDLFTMYGGTNRPALAAGNRRGQGGGFGRRGGGGYPEGVIAPTNTYRVGLGGYMAHGEPATCFSPPWSTITCYDLNTGTIKWHVPLGNNDAVNSDMDHMTGKWDSQQRRSMIVTSTGIIFATDADNRIYAYDADSGKMFWHKALPRSTEGLMSMYEVNGKAYIAICLVGGGGGRGGGGQQTGIPAGYVVYGLPKK